MKWAEFLDEVAKCVGVDKENLQVNWAFQKQKAQLPLTNEQVFADDAQNFAISCISHPPSSSWRALLFISGLIERYTIAKLRNMGQMQLL